MESADLPAVAGPVPDRLSIWPLDDGSYGLDATFQGRTGFERAEEHAAELKKAGVRFSLVQDLGDRWSLRFGPLTAAEVSSALQAFVY
jgi:hypothetical protein